MTANTWPDPARPGVPLNPDFPGAHWLKGYTEDAWMYDGNGVWWGPGYSHKLDAETVAAGYSYLGPCLTPDEVQNLCDDLASSERERAHQHGRADRNAAEYAREQGKREALQKRVTELEAKLNLLMGPPPDKDKLRAAMIAAGVSQKTADEILRSPAFNRAALGGKE